MKAKIRNTAVSKTDDEKTKITEKEKYVHEKYGVDSVSKVPSIHASQVESNVNRTDAEKAKSLEKAKSTKLEKYGNANFVNAEMAAATKRNFSKEHIGKINEKRKNTCMEKYGVDSVVKIPEVRHAMREKRNAVLRGKLYDEFISAMPNIKPMFSRSEFI